MIYDRMRVEESTELT